MEISKFNSEKDKSKTPTIQGMKIILERPNKKKIKILNLYIPPSGTFEKRHVDMILAVKADIISGDINTHHPAWCKKGVLSNKENTREFLWQQILEKGEYVSAFDKNIETLKYCKKEMCGSVDVFLMKPSLVFEAIPGNFLSDHRYLRLNLILGEKSTEKTPEIREKFYVNYDKLSPKELKIFWEIELNKKSVEACTVSDIIQIQDKLIKDQLRTKTFDKPKGQKEDENDSFLENSEDLTDYWTSVIENTASEKIWEVLNNIKRAKEKEISLEEAKTVKTQYIQNRNGKVVPIEKMQFELVDFFKRDICVNRKSLLQEREKVWIEEKLKNAKMDENFLTQLEVIKAVKELKTDVAAGLDFMLPKLLPSNSSVFLKALFFALKKVFFRAEFPDSLKKSKLLFFVKPSKAQKTVLTVADFRGICIGKLLLKIIDTIIKTKVVYALEKSGLRNNHNGFRDLRGVTDNFGILLSKVRKNLEKKLVTALLLLDLKSAYNRLCHGKLIQKLISANFDPQLIKLIEFWLRDRVLICDKYTIYVAVSSLPQGSPLSPILFIIYCDFKLDGGDPNDCFFYFADDSSATITGKTWTEVENKVENVVREFEKWCRKNGLALSVSKTELLLINRKKTTENTFLKKFVKKEVRVLGIFVDSDMNFSYYVNVILQKKLQCLLYCMKSIAGFTRVAFRRCFLFSAIQTFVWPLFPILAMSNTLKNTLHTWFLKLVRAALRAPNFVDWQTLQRVIGMEDLESLLERQVSTKIVSIDARNHYYLHNNIKVDEVGHSEIFTELVRKSTESSRKTRFERPELPFLYNRKVVQNEVCKMVNKVVKIDELPWRKSQTYFTNVDFKNVKFMARATVKHLGEKRENLIKTSLYKTELKKAPNKSAENEHIENYIESRRQNWNFIPDCVKNCPYIAV